MNNKYDTDLVMERLDRAFVSIDWLNQYPSYSLRNLPIIRSDHGLIILDFDYFTPFRKRPFKFEHMWTTHPSCKDMVQQAWLFQSHRSRVEQLWKNLLNVKKIALAGNKQVFGKVQRVIRLKQDQLQQIQNSISTIKDVRLERSVRNDLEELLNKEELMWPQKARSNWILQGDRNTKFFQTVVRQKRARNRIMQIKNDLGCFTENPNEIEAIFTNHFRSYFQNSIQSSFDSIVQELQSLPIPSLLSPLQLASLNKPITTLDIEEFVFQIGAYKAPGSDGIPAFFFHKYWGTIKTEVISTVLAFFHSGYLFKPLNQTFITLIPKIPFPEEVFHFKSISLCNVVYKIISKVMVNRLKPLMNSIITPYQNAFIKGRNISDNILISHEIIYTLRREKGRKTSFGVLKIDMSKAYDRVNWTFLKAVLTVMEFEDKWIKWIMEYVTTVSYTIIVNVNLTSSFKPSQGLRQGDPLSPYLFIFCANILSISLSQAQNLKQIQGVKVGRNGLSFTHLFFADDSLLFFKKDSKTIRNLQLILDWYYSIFGQKINPAKLDLYCSPNMPTKNQESLAQTLQVNLVQNPTKYLGMHFKLKGNRCTDFQFMVDKLQVKLQSWKARLLS